MSASTGRSLQIVRSPDGHLTVDGVGAEGPSAANGMCLFVDKILRCMVS